MSSEYFKQKADKWYEDDWNRISSNLYTSVTELGPAPLMSRNTSYEGSPGEFELEFGVETIDNVPAIGIPQDIQSLSLDRPVLFGEASCDDPSRNDNRSIQSNKSPEPSGGVEYIDEETNNLYIPGNIIHLYTDNGVYRAAACDFNFESFGEMKLYQNMISDHSMRNYRENIRSALHLAQKTDARFKNGLKSLVPEWQVRSTQITN